MNSEVISSIKTSMMGLRITELKEVQRHAQLLQNRLITNKYTPGSPVKFLDKNNNTIEGTVVRVNPKTLSINANGIKWRVSYCYIVEEE